MRYLADILTFTRFILATIIIVFAFLPDSDIGTAFLLFIIAELTDAFDGTLATKFPFPKNKTPKYRKYAAKYDMLADALTALAFALFFILKVNLVAGLIVVLGYGIFALIIDMIIYGRLLGHPDDCTDNSLMKRNFPLAKKIILARRYGYTICLGILNAVTLFATNWSDQVKYIGFTAGCLTFVFVWFFLRQRRQNVSRDAVDIEKKLSKKQKEK